MIVICKEDVIHEVMPLIRTGVKVGKLAGRMATGKTGAIVAILFTIRKLRAEQRKLKEELKTAKKLCKQYKDEERQKCMRRAVSKHYAVLSKNELQISKEYVKAAKASSGPKQKYYNIQAERHAKKAKLYAKMSKLALDPTIPLSNLYKLAKQGV